MLLTFKLFTITISLKFTTRKAINVSLLIVKTPNKETYGITSRTKDGKHIIFLDYDSLEYHEVMEELTFLAREFGLSNFYIFQNDIEKSFHAICLDKFPMWEAVEIISSTSADPGFKKAPRLFRLRRWVLRVAQKGERKKPKLITTMKTGYNSREISTAHRIFLNEHYNTKIKKAKKEDGFKETVEIIEYNTASKC